MKCDYCDREAYAITQDYKRICRIHDYSIYAVTISCDNFGNVSTVYHYTDGSKDIVNNLADWEAINRK